ncbi:glycyl radical protein [Gelria sp. Kuro-4]|uniref:glycyl radical protein n=1 Tax=Gelria sp. Kuro-4 TaxID=2796927 RepID=UPI001BED667F|nr:glycyl radical protein [Gelria sp. Kuro-4]BCV24887.1 formate C-acetyltransferase [Gelria sp. Kuro-4]
MVPFKLLAETHILSSDSQREQRIQRLRNQILAAKGRKGEYVGYVCIERARLVTQSYRETEGQPEVIRRAKALRNVLEGMPVYILPDELIVGQVASKHRSVEVFPENSVDWLETELDLIETRSQDRFLIPPEVKKELRESIIPYWKGKTLQDYVDSSMPEDTWFYRKNAGVFFMQLHERGGMGHVIPNYARALSTGLDGLIAGVNDLINQIDLSRPKGLSDIAKVQYLQAARIALQAASIFIERYADEAQRLAAQEAGPGRKDELLKIARVCRKIAHYPAETWWEALQLLWFLHIIIQLEMDGVSISVGRFDQYALKYLRSDPSYNPDGLEEAQELLEAFFVKFNEVLKLWDYDSATTHAGFPMGQNLTVGGVDAYGNDATNELTYMCLEAYEHVHLFQPALTLRIHRNTPQELFLRGLEVIRLGGGMPQLANDEVIIPSLLSRGVSLDDARNYAPVGCLENATDTNLARSTWGARIGGFYSLPRPVELALHNGVDPLTGLQVGPQTGDATTFTTFDQLMEAVRKQDEFFAAHMAKESNILDYVHSTYRPTPFLASLLDGCLESGLDPSAGGAYYNWSGVLAASSATAGDMLYAIKHLVFDTRKISMKEIIEALKANWEGYEHLRQKCLRVVKYGNDQDEVDAVHRARMASYYDALEKNRTPRGGTFHPGVISGCRYIKFGKLMGATPDGRKAREPLADGVAPISGFDLKGPTAVVKSVAKLDHIRLTGGVTFNLKISPGMVDDRAGLLKWMELTKTYFEMGGMQIQYNIVSRAVLEDAQKHPEKHQDLIVRVAGYSAFFNELSREVQDTIIARTEHTF